MADYKYYNQRQYLNVPYPSPSLKNATVKSGGCGVCCGAMVVANLTEQEMDIPAFAQYCINIGARVNGGTDMRRLAEVIGRDYGLEYETTNDSGKLLQHLAAGGMAVANVSGNRKGYTGVFSDSGHYIVVAGAEGNTVNVLDPALYAGKFSRAGRKGKVTVDGDVCRCDVSVLAKDVYSRTPSYYLFKREAQKMSEQQQDWQLTAIKEVCERYGLDKVFWLTKAGQPITVGELFGILNKVAK